MNTSTIDDLLAHPGYKHLELVEGRLIERGLGARGSIAATRLMRVLDNYDPSERAGWLFDSTLAFRCFADRDRVRHVSMSYIKRSRLPVLDDEPFSTIVPDLIVEVTPPYLNPDEVPRRIDDFLDAGTPLAWVANYEKRIILVRRPDEPDQILRETDTLTGEDVLPGFSVKVADLFPTEGMVARNPSMTSAEIERAKAIWADYQRVHDVSDRIGQAAGIDPKTGRVWLGESAVDIVEQRKIEGLTSPLFFERIGSPTYLRKRTPRRRIRPLATNIPTPDPRFPIPE